MFIFVPLWAVLYRRLQKGAWIILSPDAYNRTWQPSAATSFTVKTEPTIAITLPTKKGYACILAACTGLLAWLLCTPFTADSPPLKLQPKQAVTVAEQALHNHDFAVDELYKPYIQIKSNFEDHEKIELQHTYIWQNYQRQIYRSLLGTYLNPPHWLVRFLRFEGSLVERAQEYAVLVGADHYGTNPTYQTLGWRHKLPEQLAGSTLTKKEAREIAHQALINEGYDVDTLYEVKAKPKQLPNRKDWTFTFANKNNMETVKVGELRLVVSIAGDHVNLFTRKVQIPEHYKRNERNNKTVTRALQTICQLLIWVLFIAGMFLALLYWAKKALPTYLFIGGFVGFALLFALNLINSWPNIIAQFNTQAPFMNQVLNTYGILIARYLIRATICAFIFSLVIATRPRYGLKLPVNSMLVGIAAGLALHGSWAIIELFKPSIEPLWGYYNAMGATLPLAGFALHYIMEFLIYSLALSLCVIGLNYITDNGHRRLGIAGALCIIISLTMTGMQSLETVPYWIISSVALGSIMVSVWYFMLRFAYATVALAIAISFSLSIAQQMAFNLIPHVWIAGLLTIITILGISVYWFILCTRHQHAPN